MQWFGFLYGLKAFATEGIAVLAGGALLVAGFSILGAVPATLKKIPLIGTLIESIQRAAGFVLIGLGLMCFAFAGGYFWRGSLEREIALQNRIATDKALKVERDRRDKAVADARAAEAERADQLAVEIDDLRRKQREDDAKSRANDARPGLRRDGVQRLNRVR